MNLDVVDLALHQWGSCRGLLEHSLCWDDSLFLVAFLVPPACPGLGVASRLTVATLFEMSGLLHSVEKLLFASSSFAGKG